MVTGSKTIAGYYSSGLFVMFIGPSTNFELKNEFSLLATLRKEIIQEAAHPVTIMLSDSHRDIMTHSAVIWCLWENQKRSWKIIQWIGHILSMQLTRVSFPASHYDLSITRCGLRGT